ncbi:MAG: hypothetical protein U9Q84_04300 [Thermodesulfobacteriota bacterium]|nr:hypothetical protein [Thermodesulfobacteriota bacterium]
MKRSGFLDNFNIALTKTFKVEQKGDIVRGELKKFDQALLEKKLDMIGRLLGSVRLLDMVLSDDGQIEWYVKEFFKGNYTFAVER